jgi:hypothetical protein
LERKKERKIGTHFPVFKGKCVSIFSESTEECLLSALGSFFRRNGGVPSFGTTFLFPAQSALQKQFGSFFSRSVKKDCHTKFGRMELAKKLYVCNSLIFRKWYPFQTLLECTKSALQIPNAHTFSQRKPAFIGFYRSRQFVHNVSHGIQGFLYCMKRAAENPIVDYGVSSIEPEKRADSYSSTRSN